MSDLVPQMPTVENRSLESKFINRKKNSPQVAMYLEYWGFQKFPFENVPDPYFFYLSKTHEEGLNRLIQAAKMRKGGAILSGEIGCGKTTLTRVYLQELSAEQFDIALILHPKLDPVEFLQEVLYQFGIKDVPDTKVQCVRLLDATITKNTKANREALLILDEAHLLSEATLKDIGLIINHQVGNHFLNNILFVGRSELKAKIKGMEELEQRIATEHHLTPFDRDDTVRYMTFRLEKAGREENMFTQEAMERIHEITGGVPRKINNLCDLSLLIGSSKRAKVIDPKIIDIVINDGALL